MTDDLVKRLREVPSDGTGIINGNYWCRVGELTHQAANRIEQLEYALRSIAEAPSGCHPAFGAEIPDGTTIWKVVVYMQETAKDALEEER